MDNISPGAKAVAYYKMLRERKFVKRITREAIEEIELNDIHYGQTPARPYRETSGKTMISPASDDPFTWKTGR